MPVDEFEAVRQLFAEEAEVDAEAMVKLRARLLELRSSDLLSSRSGRRQSRWGQITRGRSPVVLAGLTVLVLILIGTSVFALQQGPDRTPRSHLAASGTLPSLRWNLVSDLTALWHTSSLTYTLAIDLSCPSANTCYQEHLVGTRTAIEVTHDGGTKWKSLAFPATEGTLTCITASICAALGGVAGPTRAGHEAFLETIDGGRTWSSLPLSDGYGYDILSCATATFCVAVGTSNSGLSAAVVTKDGGHTWSQSELPPRLEPPAVHRFTELEVNGLQCFSGGSCTAVGVRDPTPTGGTSHQHSSALYSTDGGSIWNSGRLPSGFVPQGLSCGDAAHCMALGGPWAAPLSADAVSVSTDGGRVWTKESSPRGPANTQSLNWISCPTSGECWVAGDHENRATSEVSDGFLAETSDQAQSWHFAELPRGIDSIIDISCPNANTCYGVASQRQPSGRYALVLLSNHT